MKRIVLDTNVIVAAFFWKGYPRTIYNLVKEKKVTLLSSFKIEAEFIRVLAYPKFGLNSTEIFPIVNDLRKHVDFINIKSKIEIVKEDPTDNIFLECAVDGKADFVISGDHHLLELGTHKGIKIFKPKDFLITEGYV